MTIPSCFVQSVFVEPGTKRKPAQALAGAFMTTFALPGLISTTNNSQSSLCTRKSLLKGRWPAGSKNVSSGSPAWPLCLSGRSTTSDLLEAFNDWTLALNDKNSVAVANIDFAKAFDSVSHSKLLCKLQSYGISGRLLCWLSHISHNFCCSGQLTA